MAAYNWILTSARCPSCDQDTTIKCQTHVASSYDGGDSGRFHDQTYQLGEVMRWFPATDRRFSAEEESINPTTQRKDREACYSSCLDCGARLCVVIRFQEITPIEVVHISSETDWLAGYLK